MQSPAYQPDPVPSKPTSAPLSVHMLFRHPGRFVSLEQVFGEIAAHLPADINCTQHVAPKTGTRPRTLAANMRWAGRQRADVVHITGDIQYATLGIRHTPVVLTIPDARAIAGPPSLRRSLLRWLWFTFPGRHAAVITTLSEAAKSEICRRCAIPSAKVHVLPCCASPVFRPQPIPPPRGKPPRILHVGTTDNKNLERLADALEGLPCSLQILGKPTPEQSSRLIARGVDFQTHTDLGVQEVVDLYATCDLVSFVSIYEGFGMPILEAQAVGRPVITSNCSSMPEVAGDGAMLVDPFEVAAIREGLSALLHDATLREHLIGRGLANVKRFGASRIAKHYAQLYHAAHELWRGQGKRSR